MSSPPTSAAADVPQFRPFYPAQLGRPYSLDLLKAYSDLQGRPAADDRRDPAASAPELKRADPLPLPPSPQVTADSSGSPSKPADRKDETKTTSCDSTEQLAERCSSPAAVKPTSDATSDPALDPGIRRYRTAFRPDQIKRLESEFLKDNYVSRPKRNEMANDLGLAEGTIKVWFQNRRMKHKRQQMTSWPLDPRFTDPTLAAVLLQAAVASGAYPCWGGMAAPPLPYYGPLAAAKCRFSPYAPLPVRPQPSAPFLLSPLEPALHAPLARQLPPTVARAPEGRSPAVTSEQGGLFRPFRADSPAGDRH